MPNIKSAKKRILVNETKAARNKAIKSKVKTAVIKAFEAAVEGNAKDKQELYAKAVSMVDKAWSKGVLKKNTASRKKATLTKLLNK